MNYRLSNIWRFCCLATLLLLPVQGRCLWPYESGTPRYELEEEIRRMESDRAFSARDTAYINRLNELAGELRYYKADSLLLLAQKALRLSREADYSPGASHAYMRLGDYHSDRGSSDKAVECYKKSLELAGTSQDMKMRLRMLNNLSGEYAYRNDYSGALNGYLEALEMAESLNDLLMMSIINENIANLYANQKDYDEALFYYKKVKRWNDSLGNEISNAESMSNLASMYADMGQLEYAMFNVNQSIDIFEKNRILDWLAFAYETKGKVYLKKSNFKWALYWYNQSEMLHQQLDDDRARIDLYNGMAEAYFGQGNDSLASVYASEAYTISQSINFMKGTRDCAETLYRIYRKKEDYATALVYHELFQQLSDSIAHNENQQSLTLQKTKALYEHQKQVLIEENEKALARQNRYIRVGSGMLLIALVVIYLINRYSRLQKQLAQELSAKKDMLEKRKEELQANNETKTKLFSIIGHDLRGPIGALQGLLQMFKDGEVGKEEFLSFMPKLRSDVDHIYFTLNNLLSWGNSQLNGSVTKPAAIPLASLVQENINLLSEIAENKSIRVVNEIPDSVMVWSDPNQIDIVVRNLISNALKFTPENGMVTMQGLEREGHWEISIRDTGVGMDRITLEGLFKEKSHNSTYGTNNEKGTGLGLSLCKEMIENNQGRIWVESMVRKGSTFYFTLPKAEKKYSQAV